MRKRILFVVLLALAIVLLFAMTASAKPEAPHFVTHSAGTLDSHSTLYWPELGIPYAVYDDPLDPEAFHYVLVDGYIDVTVDVESVGDATGPYDDGSDWNVKWDYKAKGFVTADVHVTDPYGNPVHKRLTAKVETITVVGQGHWTYFLDVKCKGETYTCYVGYTPDWGGYHLFLPFLGKVLGKADGVYNAILYSSAGDEFDYTVNDPDVDLGL